MDFQAPSSEAERLQRAPVIEFVVDVEDITKTTWTADAGSVPSAAIVAEDRAGTGTVRVGSEVDCQVLQWLYLGGK